MAMGMRNKGAVIGIIMLLVAIDVTGMAMMTYGRLNRSRLSDDYYTDVESNEEFENKYAKRGPCSVEHASEKSDDPSIRTIHVYYPKGLEKSREQCPLVMIVNGDDSPSKTHLPFLERLASWGFVVVGNDGLRTESGEAASKTLDYILSESPIGEFVDQRRMGIAGYSQGGDGAINAVTEFENGGLYKALFTSGERFPGTGEDGGRGCDPKGVGIDWFMSITGKAKDDSDGTSPSDAMRDAYDALPNRITKIMGRCVTGDNSDPQTVTDGYLTAWMLWELRGDDTASNALIGEEAEILSNPNWKDVDTNR